MKRHVITPVERLARAVLLFHGKGPWIQDKAREWVLLTGTPEATTQTLRDLAQRLLADSKRKRKEET